jgi:hypothetical protein
MILPKHVYARALLTKAIRKAAGTGQRSKSATAIKKEGAERRD